MNNARIRLEHANVIECSSTAAMKRRGRPFDSPLAHMWPPFQRGATVVTQRLNTFQGVCCRNFSLGPKWREKHWAFCPLFYCETCDLCSSRALCVNQPLGEIAAPFSHSFALCAVFVNQQCYQSGFSSVGLLICICSPFHALSRKWWYTSQIRARLAVRN